MKDLLGLIKYLLMMLFVAASPVIIWFMLGIIEDLPSYFYEDNIILRNLYYCFKNNSLFCNIYAFFLMLLICGMPFIYVYCPVKLTQMAMETNKSKYLNFFFNNFFLTTLLLILICITPYIIVSFETINILSFKIHIYYIIRFLDFILPVYFIIYITTIFTNPTKEITNAPKLIIWLNKIPKWVYSILIAFISLLNRENGHIYAIIALSCISILLNIRTKPQLN